MFWRTPPEEWEAGNPPRVPGTHFPAGFRRVPQRSLARGHVPLPWGQPPTPLCAGALVLSGLAPLPLCPAQTVLLLLKLLSGYSSPLGLLPFSRLYSFLSDFHVLRKLTLSQ